MAFRNKALIDEILTDIRKLRRAVYHYYIKTSRQFGLTETQADVLRSLLVLGAMSSADLSRCLFMSPANITGVIDRLERKALVERVRQKADRRVALISLTESGKILSKQLPDPIENKLVSGLKNLDTHQVQSMAEAINKIIDLLGADEIEPSPLGSHSVSKL
jgi:MarR family transcriptional regulator, organic hydroperoxide resistance regulator